MNTGKRLQQRNPFEKLACLISGRALRTPRIDGLGDLVLFLDRPRRSRPAVVKHLGRGRPRTNLPVVRPDAKTLRALIGVDVATKPDAAHLPAIPAAARRDAIEAAVEMEILDEQALDAFVTVPLGDLLFENPRAALVQDFVGLDVDAPRSPARVHRPLRLDGQHEA